MTDPNMLIELPVIVGPTAVGKTEAAVLMAEAVGGEIVSADSRQIYKGMAIGTGAPSTEELSRVQHHLAGAIGPAVRLSAGEFARKANDAIIGVHNRGKMPIVVGGSGLYVRALVDGLAPIPPADPDLRREIEDQINDRGMEAMTAELAGVDPEYAAKVGPLDRKRLVRALEVWHLTGRSFSSWHDEGTNSHRYEPRFFGLTRPRPELNQLIDQRVRRMIASGWIDELQALIEHYGGIEQLPPTVTEALGYRELVAHLNGEIGLEGAIQRIVIATRRFAKRQMTWFRADPRIEWREESGPDAPQRWAEWIISELKASSSVNEPSLEAHA